MGWEESEARTIFFLAQPLRETGRKGVETAHDGERLPRHEHIVTHRMQGAVRSSPARLRHYMEDGNVRRSLCHKLQR